MIEIKKHPELRHVLSHMELAIRSLADGLPADALYELDQIRNLIYFDSDQEQADFAKELYMAKCKKGRCKRGRGKKRK